MTPRNRKKRRKGLRRGLPLQVRVEAAEKHLYVRAADESGLSISSWARTHLNRAAREQLRDLEQNREVLALLLEEGAEKRA